MALKTKVKINRITNLTDARYCSGMYVDILGFCLEEGSPHYVSPTRFQEITGWISGIDYAAEFTEGDAYTIERLLAEYPGITWIESGDLDTLLQLKSLGKKLIYAVKIEELETILPKIDFFQDQEITLHLTSTNKSISIDNESIINIFSSKITLFLGAGITPSNANSLCELPGLFGFALDSGDEIKPGLRDFDQLAAILESLELED
ncbi:MAG: phosphoribosylanthranilate isomerase [Bacteroidetes bacterium]|nr:phosphoribosylanthranilate isomerase [Bacteroidota bacterium]MDA1268469.1 phosphoribosylanthranilate isomerase [Bacteroidota bacterium]